MSRSRRRPKRSVTRAIDHMVKAYRVIRKAIRGKKPSWAKESLTWEWWP